LSVLVLVGCSGTGDEDSGGVVTSCAGDDAGDAVISIAPYVQHVTPTSAWILWETQTATGSRVDFGDSSELGQARCGELIPVLVGGDPADAATQVHAVQLDGLQPATTYFYAARTGATKSDVRTFRTAPTGDSEASFSFVAMSDSQRDDARPDQFAEVVNDGVLGVADASELAMVLFPGDLVDDGWSVPEWQDEFFGAGANLFGSVPVYPAVGNHEGGSPHYFRYFQLPDNGLDEHTYWVDYSNLRVVALNSNAVAAPQLAWLDEVLAATCEVDDIDFVFAQLHHPFLSELWTPGESDFTGQVVGRLEAFSSSCGKPSIHFFGHTHGYSRGQSRDHQHLWVNVASAGGRLDRWGEYPQADYDEFSVSEDAYGFVRVDVHAGDAPSFELQRYSLGNPDSPLDNEVTDSIEVWRDNAAPATPTAVSTSAVCDEALLSASPYSDTDGHAHQGTHWQVAASCDSFDAPLVERWRQSRNDYLGVDLQADDDLTDEAMPELSAGQDVCWRVRYRDAGLRWSEWSAGSAVTLDGC
jgi:hypothetical protein